LDNLVRLTLSQDATLTDDVGVVANTEGFTNVVVGNEYAYLAIPKEAHNPLNFPNGNRVNTSKRLI
jgi:hypothetical protein